MEMPHFDDSLQTNSRPYSDVGHRLNFDVDPTLLCTVGTRTYTHTHFTWRQVKTDTKLEKKWSKSKIAFFGYSLFSEKKSLSRLFL